MKPNRTGPFIGLIGGLTAVFLLLPLLAVIPVSFTSKRYLSLPSGNWSTRHYEALLTKSAWADSVLLSLKTGRLAGVALLPMVAPPVVSALTLYYFLRSVTDWNSLVIYDGWLGVAVAHTVMVVPYAVVVIMVSLGQVDRKIDLAARSMGASGWTRITAVILPNIRFGVLSGFLLSFILSWDEIAVTLFITSVRAITLPRRMWMGLRDNIDPAVAALSVVLIAIVTLVILGRVLWQWRSSRRT